jgi:biopolymer transport protein ExbD
MAMAMVRSDGQSNSEINMTPLIDVMLVLLVIFIITLPSQTHAIKIDNPSSNLHPPALHDVIDLSIDFDGTISWNNQPIDRAKLQRYIGQEAALTSQPEVRITVDRFARYEIVAQTMADLQHGGLQKFGFVNDDLLL